MAYGVILGQTPQIPESKDLPLSGGTMNGSINMGGNKITNLQQGTSNSDAVTLRQLQNLDVGIKATTYTSGVTQNYSYTCPVGMYWKFAIATFNCNSSQTTFIINAMNDSFFVSLFDGSANQQSLRVTTTLNTIKFEAYSQNWRNSECKIISFSNSEPN